MALLAYLATEGRPFARSSLCALLWPESDETHARAALRRTLYAITKIVPEGLIETAGDTVALASTVECDLRFLLSFVTACRAGSSRSFFTGTNRNEMDRALELCRREFLAGFSLRDSEPFDTWVAAQSVLVREAQRDTLRALARFEASHGRYSEAADIALLWSTVDPLDESAHQHLAEFLAKSGRRGAALRVIDDFENRFRLEAGDPVSDTTVELRALLQTGAPLRKPSPAGGNVKPRLDPAINTAYALAVRIADNAATRLAGMKNALYGISIRYGSRMIEMSAVQVVLLFGLLGTSENAAEVAVRAALDARDAASLLSTRIAAAVAPAAGPASNAEAPTVDDAVAAVELLQSARYGQTLVAPPVYENTGDTLTYKPLQHRNGVREVVGITLDRGRPAGLRTQLVGRAEEVRRLRNAVLGAAGSTPGVVTISGEPGIGKSRLVEEVRFDSQVAAQIHWLEGRCLDLGIAASYWPITDVLRQQLGIVASSSQTMVGGVVERELTRLVSGGHLEAEEALSIAPFLEMVASRNDTAELSLDPEEGRRRTFDALIRYFEAVAAERPLCIVLEDLHWADALSLDFIVALMSLAGRQDRLTAICIVCVYREEVGHRSRDLSLHARRTCPDSFTHIELHELTRSQVWDLARSIARQHGVDSVTVRPLVERAQGNPFFVEELVRATFESTDAAPPDDFRSKTPVPHRVQTVILASVQRLPRSSAEALEAASVLGRVFDEATLTLLGASSEAISDLLQRGLIFVERGAPRVEYAFRHVLIRDAIYEGLEPASRRRLHREVVLVLQNVFGDRVDDYAEQLAYHADAANLPDQALTYLIRAGERAIRAGDNDAAFRFLSRAVELARETGDHRELEAMALLGIPITASRGYGSDESIAHYRQACALIHSLTPATISFRTLFGLWRARIIRGDIQEGITLSDRLSDLADRSGERSLKLEAHRATIVSYIHAGKLNEAAPALAEALAMYDATLDAGNAFHFGHDPAVTFWIYDAISLWLRGFPDRARRRVAELIAMMKDSPHRISRAYPFVCGSLIHAHCGDVPAARTLAEEGLEISRASNLPMFVAMARFIAAWTRFHEGAGPAALGEMQAALDQWDVHGGGAFRADFVAFYGDALMEYEPEHAIQLQREVLAEIDSGGEYCFQPHVVRVLGCAQFQVGDRDTGLDTLRRGAESAQAMGAVSFEIEALNAAVTMCETTPEDDRLYRQAAHYRAALETVYRRFAEGNDSADLRTAARLLGGQSDGT